MRNCLVAIGSWLALFAGYSFFFFRSDLPPEGALLGGAMMAFLVGLGLMMMSRAWYATGDRVALARFESGERPLDGELAAVTGEIRPTFEPLRAPLSGRECVVYRYDVVPDRGRNQDVARDYVGFAFARCAIHSPYGTYHLGTFPVMNDFPEQRSSAQAYIEATEFEELSKALTLVKYTLELHQQQPPLRVDWRLGTPSQGAVVAKETIVESGATVTAYGRYSASANALTGGGKADGYYLRLYPGGASTLSVHATANLVTGAVLIVVANVGMLILLGKIASL